MTPGRTDAATEALCARLRQHHPDADPARIDYAVRLAERAHAGVLRRSGHPYLHHPVAVAQYVADWEQRPACVEAALLHDVGCPDLSNLRPDDMEEARSTLGGEVMTLASTMTSVGTGRFPLARAEANHTGPELRELLLLKLADRLHYAQTWDFVPPRKARRKAVETQDVVIPWANLLGLPAVASQLTSLADDFLANPQDDLSPSLLHRALNRLPPEDRARYASEWAADLRSLDTRQERVLMALGLLYSARTIARQSQAL